MKNTKWSDVLWERWDAVYTAAKEACVAAEENEDPDTLVFVELNQDGTVQWYYGFENHCEADVVKGRARVVLAIWCDPERRISAEEALMRLYLTLEVWRGDEAIEAEAWEER